MPAGDLPHFLFPVLHCKHAEAIFITIRGVELGVEAVLEIQCAGCRTGQGQGQGQGCAGVYSSGVSRHQVANDVKYCAVGSLLPAPTRRYHSIY